MPLKSYYVDLHVHLGRSEDGSPIKITASSQLTFANCIKEAVDRKGLDILGIVDCSSRKILKDIHDLMKKGQLIELEDGGLRHRDKVTILLGAEVETSEDEGRKIAHHLVYFPFLKQMEEFSKTMGKYISNMDLSTQRARLTSRELLTIARSLGGVFMIAHAFTPHKSVYGNCAKRISDLFGSRSDEISALELGLSSDSYLADRIDELKPITFISNSDAHSLAKLGREYNVMELEKPTFKEVILALKRQSGRKVSANYGLDPKLGKYHRSFCETCEKIISEEPPPVLECPYGKDHDLVTGVLDRITVIQDHSEPIHPEHRPRYHYQVPLEFVPGLGPATLNRLIAEFETEMAVLHQASKEDITKVVGWKIANQIILAREGLLPLQAGGGGHYGKVAAPSEIEQLRMI